MTKKQLSRQRKGGKAVLAKYGRAYFQSLGRRGGSHCKPVFAQVPQVRVIEREERPGSCSRMLEALKHKENLAKGGLPIACDWFS